jgi:hypothetical protein
VWDTPHSALPRRVIGSSTDGHKRRQRGAPLEPTLLQANGQTFESPPELWCMGCNHHAASATGSTSARRTATRNSPPWA